MSNKRRRTEIPFKVKSGICQYYREKNEKATRDQIIDYVKTTYDLDIGKSTVTDILKSKEKWIKEDGYSTSEKSRVRKGNFDNLECALYTWFIQARQKGLCLTDDLLKQKAKQFGPHFEIPNNFQYSNGWISNFKKRHGITMTVLHGEAKSADLDAAEGGRKKLQEVLKDYDLSCIYNMDESALFYNLDPSRSLDIVKNPSGKKKVKN